MTAVPHRCDTKGGGWTLDTLQEHFQALSDADNKFMAERDRRYAEVNTEREKALKIKEEADKAALGLAREIQSYKDEKANQLREQITGERGSFATKEDLAAAMREINAQISPINSFVVGAGAQTKGTQNSIANIVSIASVIYAIVATIGGLIVLTKTPPPQVIYTPSQVPQVPQLPQTH